MFITTSTASKRSMKQFGNLLEPMVTYCHILPHVAHSRLDKCKSVLLCVCHSGFTYNIVGLSRSIYFLRSSDVGCGSCKETRCCWLQCRVVPDQLLDSISMCSMHWGLCGCLAGSATGPSLLSGLSQVQPFQLNFWMPSKLNFSHGQLGPMHFGSLWHIRFPAIVEPWASNIALRIQRQKAAEAIPKHTSSWSVLRVCMRVKTSTANWQKTLRSCQYMQTSSIKLCIKMFIQLLCDKVRCWWWQPSDSRANGVIGQQSQIERLNAEYLNYSHAHLGPMHFGSLWDIRLAIVEPWASNIAVRMHSKWLQWQKAAEAIPKHMSSWSVLRVCMRVKTSTANWQKTLRSCQYMQTSSIKLYIKMSIQLLCDKVRCWWCDHRTAELMV